MQTSAWFVLKNTSVMLEGTVIVPIAPYSPLVFSVNFGAIKDVTDFLVNVFFSTLQLELLWGNQICHQESW